MGLQIVELDGVTVETDPVDGKGRANVDARAYLAPPVVPAATTPVTISADSPLSLSTVETAEHTIADGKSFHLQQVVYGAEGDPTEKGSRIDVIYFDGTTEHVIERVYVTGFTRQITPDTRVARDGTALGPGDAGGTKKIRVRRTRLSTSPQEVDAVVRGYEF